MLRDPKFPRGGAKQRICPSRRLRGAEKASKDKRCAVNVGRVEANATPQPSRIFSEFVGRTYEDGRDIHLTIKSVDKPTILMPVDRTEDEPAVIALILQMEVKALVVREGRCQEKI